MQAKLTLRLDDATIRNAKRYSAKSRKSVSRLVEDYFACIDAGESADEPELTPRVRSLLGSLAGGGKIGEEDYRAYLEEKHR